MADDIPQPPRLDEGTRRDKYPYGKYAVYADPGYKADGKRRYPIDNAAHTRAGWSYINMPKNHAGYTRAQVSAIMGRIKSAAKKFDVELPEPKEPTPTPKRIFVVGPAPLPAAPQPAPPGPPPLRLLRSYAALGEIPMFEISVEDVQGFCVYVLLEDETPIYVGESIGVLGRLSTHLRDAQKGPRTTSIQVLKCKCEAQMHELETRLIQLYKPEFNVAKKVEYIDGYLSVS